MLTFRLSCWRCNASSCLLKRQYFCRQRGSKACLYFVAGSITVSRSGRWRYSAFAACRIGRLVDVGVRHQRAGINTSRCASSRPHIDGGSIIDDRPTATPRRRVGAIRRRRLARQSLWRDAFCAERRRGPVLRVASAEFYHPLLARH